MRPRTKDFSVDEHDILNRDDQTNHELSWSTVLRDKSKPVFGRHETEAQLNRSGRTNNADPNESMNYSE